MLLHTHTRVRNFCTPESTFLRVSWSLLGGAVFWAVNRILEILWYEFLLHNQLFHHNKERALVTISAHPLPFLSEYLNIIISFTEVVYDVMHGKDRRLGETCATGIEIISRNLSCELIITN